MSGDVISIMWEILKRVCITVTKKLLYVNKVNVCLKNSRASKKVMVKGKFNEVKASVKVIQ